MIFRDASTLLRPGGRRLVFAMLLDRRVRELFLETIIVTAIITVLAGLAVRTYPTLADKLVMIEAVSQTLPGRIDAATQFAVTGRSPEASGPIELSSSRRGPPFTDMRWRDGELVLVLSENLARRVSGPVARAPERRTSLSFRIARGPSGAAVWLCGHAEPHGALTASPARHTNVPPRYLPHFCRF